MPITATHPSANYLALGFNGGNQYLSSLMLLTSRMTQRIYLLFIIIITCLALLNAKVVLGDSDVNISIPELVVLDQHSTVHSFYKDLIKNKIVAINFIFTACTSSCSLSTTIFKQVQKKLGQQKVQLITVTVDPANDTPERLLEFSKKFNATSGWEFITGERQNIFGLLKNLGVYSADKNDHSNMVIVGNDATHNWSRLYGFPQADEIISALQNVSHKSKN